MTRSSSLLELFFHAKTTKTKLLFGSVRFPFFVGRFCGSAGADAYSLRALAGCCKSVFSVPGALLHNFCVKKVSHGFFGRFPHDFYNSSKKRLS